MKNLSLITICLVLLFTPSTFINAQQQQLQLQLQLQLQWAGAIEGTTNTNEYAYDMTVDNNNNVIVTGWMSNTAAIDFDFGAGSTVLNPSTTSNDIFLAKYNTNGIYQWAFTLGSTGDEIAYAVTTDNAGNIYMVGEFEGTVDFDPSGATANLTQVGSFSEFFMASYDANGNYRWAFNIATDAGFQWGDIEFDGTNLVVGGDFRGSNVDFNPGAPTFFMSPTGQDDMFVAKYTTAGTFVNAIQLATTGGTMASETLYGLGVDASGNIYITGQFGNVLDMDPTAGVYNLTAVSFSGSGRDWFLGKYDSNLNLIWANSFGGGQGLSSGNQGRDVVVDPSGNVYVSGIYHDVCDFDPSGATQNLTTSSNADEDFFIAKYNSSGNYIWAFGVGLDATAGCTSSADDRVYKMDIDGNNNILVSGIFKGWTAIAGCEVDFDPMGAGNNQASNNLSEDGFFAVYDQNGINQAMYAIGTTNNAEQTRGIAFDSNGDIYVAGYFQSSNGNLLDMDPTGGTFNLSATGLNNDMYVAKYSMFPPCTAPVLDFSLNGNLNPSTYQLCNGDPLVFDVSGVVLNGAGSGIFDDDGCGNGFAPLVSNTITILPTAPNYPAPGTSKTYCIRATGGCLVADTCNCVTVTACLPAQPTTQFCFALGGAGTEEGTSVAATNDGGYISIGYTTSYGAGGADIYLVKTDANGSVMWEKTIGGTGDDRGKDIIQTTDGGYALTGYTDSYGAGNWDVYVVKLDASGNVTWSRTVGNTRGDVGYAIVQTTDGGYIVGGEIRGDVVNVNLTEMYLIKLDAAGVVSWTRTVGDNAGSNDYARDVIQTSDGGYLLLGTTRSYGAGSYNTYMAKFDALGTLSWTKVIGGGASDYGNAVVETSDGGFAVAGQTTSFAAGGTGGDAYIYKVNSTGTLLWSRTFGVASAHQEYAEDILENAAGELVVVGRKYNLTENAYKMFVLGLNSVGVVQWAKESVDGATSFGVAEAINGSYGIAGIYSDSPTNDFFILSVDAIGDACCTQPTTYVTGTGGNETNGGVQSTGGVFGIGGATIAAAGVISYNCSVLSLVASFTMSSDTVCLGDSITFTNNSIGGATSWAWTFTNGTPATANTQGPHTVGFSTAGSHNITLQVGDGTNTDDTTFAIVVIAPSTGVDVQTACSSYTWIDGVTYTSSNNSAVDTLFGGAASGCDSIVTLNLTINLPSTSVDVQTACNSYTWIDGITYTASNNTAQDTIFGGAANSCDSIITLNLTITPSDTATFTYPQAAYCLTDADPLPIGIITAGGTFTIDNSGAINSTTGLIDITTSGQGNFIVTYITNGTCPDTATFAIAINGSFDATITQPAAFCPSDVAVNLSAVDAGGVWSGTGITSTTNGTFDPATAGSGTHQIIYTISGSCGDADTINVLVNQADTATFAYPLTFCLADANPLPTGIVTTGGAFSIDNGGTINATTGEIDIAATGLGNFTIKYVTAGLCPDSTTQSIAINACLIPLGSIYASDTAICENECVDFTDASVGGTSWSWTFPGGNPATSTNQNPTVCYNASGSYDAELIVSNNNGNDTVLQTIEVTAIPTITASSTVSINLGETTTLTASGSGGTYAWSPIDWLSCVICQTTLASPEETTTYTVTLDSNGCTATDEVTVIVNFENIVFVPNIFSPNGDGNNDILFVNGKTIDILEFFIYDRWGEKVFETTDKSKGWNGDFRGKAMNKAVFVYYLRATFRDGSTTTKKGDITLIR